MAGKPVELTFITRKVEKGMEWSARPGLPPLVGVSGEEPSEWGSLGEAMSGEFRVVAVNPGSAYDLLNVIWATGEPGVLVAQGTKACELAARAAIQGVGAVRALVLVNFGGAASAEWLGEVGVPTLVFRGRQCGAQSHDEAVGIHERIRGSRLIEPEDCGERPVQEHAAALAESINWYVANLREGHMDYPVNGEPFDPRAQ